MHNISQKQHSLPLNGHNGHINGNEPNTNTVTETDGNAMLDALESNMNNKYGKPGQRQNGIVPVRDQDTPTNVTLSAGSRSYPSKSIFSAKGGTTTFHPKWFAKHKRDYGNPKKASLYIGIYFLLCFLVLLFLCIYEKLFDDPEVNIFNSKNEAGLVNAGDIGEFFSQIQLTETIFIIMCYVPFIVALIFTCRIWSISESWKIKQEILFIFIVTAVIFLGDTAITGFVFWDEPTRFVMKLILEGLILLWTTIISTIMVVHFIRKQKKKLQRRRSAVRKSRAISRELIKEISQTNILPIDQHKDDDGEVPLGYVLSNQLGYSAFLQHCVEEINVENLLFLAHVCYFKKRFLDRIKERQLAQNAKIREVMRRDRIEKQKKKDKRNKPNTIHEEQEPDDGHQNGHNGHNGQGQGQIEEEDNEDIIELQSITTDSRLTIKVDEVESELNEEDDPDLASNKMNSGASFATIKTDVAVYDDGDTEAHDDELLAQKIDWSPSNCLAILTFRMCHNFERNHNRLTLIDDDEDDEDEDIEDYYDENGIRKQIPLYKMATNLYKTFVKESSEYEINLPAKIKTKLHFFFHQNFKDLDTNDMQYHEYRLFHIFDKSWAEIWHLLTLNSYRRFLDTEHYVSIKEQLEMALADEKKSLLRLIILDSNNDQHIATLIESHDPYKRNKIEPKSNRGAMANISNISMSNNNLMSPSLNNKARLNSLNIDEMNQLNPTSLVNISVDPLPIPQQCAVLGKPLTKVKKARV